MGIAGISPNNIWVVGHSLAYSGTIGWHQTLIEHWDGTSWRVVPSPNINDQHNNDLYAVAAVAANDVWAVGLHAIDSTNADGLVEHWDGQQWSIMPVPQFSEGSHLQSVVAIASNNIWIGGQFSNALGTSAPLLLHWDGNKWQQVLVNVPNMQFSNGLWGLYAISANDIWAVGDNIPQPPATGNRTLVLHWDGLQWQIIPSPNVPNMPSSLYGIAGISDTDIWAVGRYGNLTGFPLAMHYSVPDGCPTLTPTITPTATHTPTSTATPLNTATPLPTTPTVSPTPCAAQYRDVGVEYWAYGYIHYLACRGVTAGYPDGSFRPATPISRAEYGKLLALAYGLPLTSPPTPRFRDVPPSYWAYGYIEALAAANISVGYPDGTYRPNLSISRAELVKLTVLASGAPAYSGPYTDYPDVPPSHWAYQYIKTATHRGWVGGYADGYFRPSATSSRAELAKLLYLALTFPQQ